MKQERTYRIGFVESNYLCPWKWSSDSVTFRQSERYVLLPFVLLLFFFIMSHKYSSSLLCRCWWYSLIRWILAESKNYADWDRKLVQSIELYVEDWYLVEFDEWAKLMSSVCVRCISNLQKMEVAEDSPLVEWGLDWLYRGSNITNSGRLLGN